MAEPDFPEPVGDVSDVESLNPEQLGFMCGIEVHQQLATGKLHSRQPGDLFDVTMETYQTTGLDFLVNLEHQGARAAKLILLLALNQGEIVHLNTFNHQMLG